MNKKSVPRVDNYVPPEHWGLTENGQKRMSFNYGDGFSAVLVKQKGNAPPKEVFRLRYCIRGRASTLQLGKGGIENYALARAKADEENQAINVERAQNSSLEERIKRVGSVQKERKNKTLPKGFIHIADTYRYIEYLRQNSSLKINTLIILHMTTLLDFDQLLNIRKIDLTSNTHPNKNFSYINIPISKAKNSPLANLIFFGLTRDIFEKLLITDHLQEESYFVFQELRNKSMEDLQTMLDASISSCNFGYRINITDLRSIFVDFFSKCDLLEKSKLEKIFGQKIVLKHREQSPYPTHPGQPKLIEMQIFQLLLDQWDGILSGRIYCGQYIIYPLASGLRPQY